MAMLLPPLALDEVADRIERAYRRLRPDYPCAKTPSPVWALAAAKLLQLHRQQSWIPMDPELFVAAQPAISPTADPWQDLVRAASTRHYLRRVRQIIRGLGRELHEEVRRAERRIRRGAPVDQVLLGRCRWISP